MTANQKILTAEEIATKIKNVKVLVAGHKKEIEKFQKTFDSFKTLDERIMFTTTLIHIILNTSMLPNSEKIALTEIVKHDIFKAADMHTYNLAKNAESKPEYVG